MRWKVILPLAPDDEFREVAQPPGAVAEGPDRVPGMLEQLAREGLRAREPEKAGVGGLVVRAVLAGGLAERRRIAFLVEDVVDDLEREAHVLRIPVEPVDVGGRKRLAAM